MESGAEGISSVDTSQNRAEDKKTSESVSGEPLTREDVLGIVNQQLQEFVNHLKEKGSLESFFKPLVRLDSETPVEKPLAKVNRQIHESKWN